MSLMRLKRNSLILFRIGLPVLAGLLLFGCGNREKHRELEEYVQKVKSRKTTEIEPLPEVTPYVAYTYTAYNMRSPFVPSKAEELPKKLVTNDGVHPDLNRPKEALESYPLDSLRMVGTLEKDNRKWALVVDPDGTVYRVTKGNYAGQNHGHIDQVDEDKILITEIVPDPTGGWRTRKASMALTEEGPHAHKMKGK